jgi:hypothetical protein
MDLVLCYEGENMVSKNNIDINILCNQYIASVENINASQTNMLPLESVYEKLNNYVEKISPSSIKFLSTGYYKIDLLLCSDTPMINSNIYVNFLKNNNVVCKALFSDQCPSLSLSNIFYFQADDVFNILTERQSVLDVENKNLIYNCLYIQRIGV